MPALAFGFVHKRSGNEIWEPDHITNDTSHNNQHSTIWLNIPFVGDLRKQLVKKFKRKLWRCLVDPNVDIRIKEKTTKLCFFTSTIDKTPLLSQSNVVYEFTCPGCNSSYIGKTNITFLARTQEHALTDKESAIYKHLRYCDQIKHIHGLYNLPDVFINENHPPPTVMNKEFLTQTVRANTNIIDRDDNWDLLLYKEAYHIKRSAPFLNTGLKASRELCLFSLTKKLRRAFRHHVNHLCVFCLNSICPTGPKRPSEGLLHAPLGLFRPLFASPLLVSVRPVFSPPTSPSATLENFNPKPSAYSAP